MSRPRQALAYVHGELKIGRRPPTVEVAEEPARVWSLPRHTDPDAPPSLPFRPVHRENAWLEDRVHDWNWRAGRLTYASRVTGGRVWLLLEYDDGSAP